MGELISMIQIFTKKQLKTIRFAARGIAILAILFGLPFYFGYGNPLPFLDPNYTLWDNVWLSIFPLMFLGLALGWKYEKLGGYLVTVPLTGGVLFGIISEGELITHMLVPLLAGIGYLVAGYAQEPSSA